MKPEVSTTVTRYTSPSEAPRDAGRLNSRLRGWRFNVSVGITTATVVFIVNLAVLIWAKVSLRPGDDGPGYQTDPGDVLVAFRGSCTKSRTISTVVHLLINVLSSGLLAASNSCAQCLVAPTRAEIERAHQQRRTLEVGVQSLKNLRSVALVKKVLWVLLIVTSLPVHLLYNSVLVETGVRNAFTAAFVRPQFMQDGYWNQSRADCITEQNAYTWSDYSIADNATATIEFLQEAASSYQQLDEADCIAAYSTQYPSRWANVVLVGPDADGDAVLNCFHSFGGLQDYWSCSGVDCSTDYEKKNPTAYASELNFTAWTVEDLGATCTDTSERDTELLHVEKCFAQPTADRCALRLSTNILLLVLVSNTIKLACFGLTLWLTTDPLITIGDAIASFLKEADSTTSGWSTMNTRQALQWVRDPGRRRGPRPWFPQFHRWVHAASRKRWLHSTVFFFALWLLTCVYVAQHGGGYSTGIGKENPDFTLKFPQSSYTSMAIMSNIFQLILSLFYFYYNDLLTRMLLVREWLSFGTQKKGLRVSSRPQGSQRSTYFLQVPFRFAAPLVIAFTLLHWLVSQGVFVVFIETFEYSHSSAGVYAGYQINGTEYSPLALLLALILGAIMLLALSVMAWLPVYDRDMPIVGSSSAAIAAACQSGADGVHLAYGELTWGNVRTENGLLSAYDGLTDEDRVDSCRGHATFSSGRVDKLIEGMYYE